MASSKCVSGRMVFLLNILHYTIINILKFDSFGSKIVALCIIRRSVLTGSLDKGLIHATDSMFMTPF